MTNQEQPKLTEDQENVARSILREGARLQRVEIVSFLKQYSGKALDVDELVGVIESIDQQAEESTEEASEEDN